MKKLYINTGNLLINPPETCEQKKEEPKNPDYILDKIDTYLFDINKKMESNVVRQKTRIRGKYIELMLALERMKKQAQEIKNRAYIYDQENEDAREYEEQKILMAKTKIYGQVLKDSMTQLELKIKNSQEILEKRKSYHQQKVICLNLISRENLKLASLDQKLSIDLQSLNQQKNKINLSSVIGDNLNDSEIKLRKLSYENESFSRNNMSFNANNMVLNPNISNQNISFTEQFNQYDEEYISNSRILQNLKLKNQHLNRSIQNQSRQFLHLKNLFDTALKNCSSALLKTTQVGKQDGLSGSLFFELKQNINNVENYKKNIYNVQNGITCSQQRQQNQQLHEILKSIIDKKSIKTNLNQKSELKVSWSVFQNFTPLQIICMMMLRQDVMDEFANQLNVKQRTVNKILIDTKQNHSNIIQHKRTKSTM